MRLLEVNKDERVHDIELKKLEGADEEILAHVLRNGGIVFYDDVAVKQLLESEFLDAAYAKVEGLKEYRKLVNEGWVPNGWHKYRYSALFFRPQLYEGAFGGSLYATVSYSIVLTNKDVPTSKHRPATPKKVYPRASSTLRDHLGDVTQSTVKYDPAKDIDLSQIFHEYFQEIRVNTAE